MTPPIPMVGYQHGEADFSAVPFAQPDLMHSYPKASLVLPLCSHALFIFKISILVKVILHKNIYVRNTGAWPRAMHVVSCVGFKANSLAVKADLWLTCCVTLGKERNLSESRFYHLQSEINNTHLAEVLHGLDTKPMNHLPRPRLCPWSGSYPAHPGGRLWGGDQRL